MLTFKERDATTGIRVAYTKADIPLKEYTKHVMRQGWFSVGYHYLIHPDGRMEVGIPASQHADPAIDGWQDSVCVLLMGVADGERTALQRAALDTLSHEHSIPVEADQ